jgi:hypothetical protein
VELSYFSRNCRIFPFDNFNQSFFDPQKSQMGHSPIDFLKIRVAQLGEPTTKAAVKLNLTGQKY